MFNYESLCRIEYWSKLWTKLSSKSVGFKKTEETSASRNKPKNLKTSAKKISKSNSLDILAVYSSKTSAAATVNTENSTIVKKTSKAKTELTQLEKEQLNSLMD